MSLKTNTIYFSTTAAMNAWEAAYTAGSYAFIDDDNRLLAFNLQTGKHYIFNTVTEVFDEEAFYSDLDNTASNIGGGEELFKQKTGKDLEFRTLGSSDSSITLSDSADLFDLVVNSASIDVGDFNNDGTYAAAAHTHLEADITDLDHDAVKIQGVTVDDTAIANGYVLAYNSVSGNIEYTPVGAAGEANTASNVGVGGASVFKQKSGVDLEFNSINAGSSKITVTLDVGNNEVDIDVVPSQINTADLNDDGTFAQASHTHAHTEVTDVVSTASNQGAAGVGVFIQKTGYDLEFKNINAASTGLGVVDDVANNEIDITFTPSAIDVGEFNDDLTYALKAHAHAINDLTDAITSSNSVFLGDGSGVNETGGSSNTAVGEDSMNAHIDVIGGVAVGYQSQASNTTGNANVSIGRDSLMSLTASSDTVAIGDSAMKYSLGGAIAISSYNTAVGTSALRGSSTAADNTGTGNTVVGASAMLNYTSAEDNCIFGFGTGSQLTTGSRNILIGYDIEAPLATTNDYLNIGGALTGDLSSGALTTTDELTVGNLGVSTSTSFVVETTGLLEKRTILDTQLVIMDDASATANNLWSASKISSEISASAAGGYDSSDFDTDFASKDTSDLAQATVDFKYVTDAEKVKLSNLSGTNTGDQTITLTGDATGSGTSTIVVTVQDDSHAHTIANVDGLQTALDAKSDKDKTIETKSSASEVLTTTDKDKVILATYSGTQSLTLPTAAAGLKYVFAIGSGSTTLRILPNSGDTVYLESTAAGSYVTAAAEGETITFIAVDNTKWYSFAGTSGWTTV